MRLYILYVLTIASILVAAITVVPNISERIRRFLTTAITLLVMLPSLLYLIFGGG
jgi:ABC-type phosphate transport system permease subunit